MVIVAPVCGLRPRRSFFSFTIKLPKPEILNGIDCRTYDNNQVYMAVAVLTIVGTTITLLYQGKGLDCITFSSGFAAILAAGGVGIKLKSETEPGAREK